MVLFIARLSIKENGFSYTDYEQFVFEMEQSFVKLKIAEKEERLKKEKEKRTLKPVNHKMSQKDGKYFLVRLEMEIEKLNSLIDSAEKDSRLSQIPDEASGKIRNAIGKAQLLINKRFQQFRELCRDNIENDPDKKETKSSDLQGYWDMMYIQIEDVHSLFEDIEKLRANNWLSDEVDGHLKPQKKNGTTGTPKSKKSSPNGKSPRTKNKNIDDDKVKREARSRLAAARKQAKLRAQQEGANGSLNNSLNGSWTVDTTTEDVNSADTSLSNSFNADCSLNSSSNSSSVELLDNGSEKIDISNTARSIVQPSIEVNGIA